ncbi:MAG: Protein translocase subunit SecF [Gemmatimonadaceae bacterium]|nr:Protein translocase subunit SecF [Gemmatimonadaceae bacterium]
MIRIFHNTSFDFIKWWRHAAIITIAFMVLGLASYLIKGPVNYSIEFTGGTLMQVQFTTPPNVADLRSTLDAAGIHGAEIQEFGTSRDFTIRAQDQAQIERQASAAEGVSQVIESTLRTKYADGFKIIRVEAVGPKVGSELRRGAAIAMLLASMVTLIYLAFRFEWRFGVAAVLSTAHDVLVTLAFIKIAHIEVSLVVVGGILTLLGYSGNDTIIIFDRVRENLKKARKEPLYDLLNRSVNETLPRSILTHTTTLAATLALLVFAGEVLRPFAWVMTFGIFVATFSSIYVASPLLLYIEQRFPRSDVGKAQLVSASARAKPAAEVEMESPAGRKSPVRAPKATSKA